MLTAYWKRWSSWRNSAEGIVKELLFSPNPEIVLSLPDLYEAALNIDTLERLRGVSDQWKAGELTEENFRKYKERFRSKEHKKLREGKAALRDFLECLQQFFFDRHYRDAKNPASREYLRRHFAHLSKGDVVITLNWDTTAERTLYEQGMWNPNSGYGFHRDLRIMPYETPLPRTFPVESPISVLKLHGSIGWHSSATGRVYLEHPRFLSCLGDGTLMDPEAPKQGVPEDPVLLYPSFLKQLNGPVMQEIWHLAAQSLSRAKVVDVYGYSLPESDVAVRTLLNVLRFRSEAREVRMRVHDKSPDAQDRWRAFLGDKPVVDDRLTEDPPSD